MASRVHAASCDRNRIPAKSVTPETMTRLVTLRNGEVTYFGILAPGVYIIAFCRVNPARYVGKRFEIV